MERSPMLVPDLAEVTSTELLRAWRERRRDILRSLPPHLRAEYLTLGKAIKAVQQAESITRAAPRPSAKELIELVNLHQKRVPMSAQKRKLIEAIIMCGGTATRKQILMVTEIPAGSLSQLLR